MKYPRGHFKMIALIAFCVFARPAFSGPSFWFEDVQVNLLDSMGDAVESPVVPIAELEIEFSQTIEGLGPAQSLIAQQIQARDPLNFNKVTLALFERHFQAMNWSDVPDAPEEGTRFAISYIRQMGLMNYAHLEGDRLASEVLHDIKLDFEQRLLSHHSRPQFYNRLYTNFLSPAFSNRSQCYSGTMNLEFFRRLTGSQAADIYFSQNPVLIYESGHVLPGYMVRDTMDRWVLVGVESTVLGRGRKVYGPVTQLAANGFQIRVVDAQAAIVIDTFETHIVNKEVVVRNALTKTAAHYGIPIEEIEPTLSNKYINIFEETEPYAGGSIGQSTGGAGRAETETWQAPAAQGQVQAGIAEETLLYLNRTLFAFGEPGDVPDGDLDRPDLDQLSPLGRGGESVWEQANREQRELRQREFTEWREGVGDDEIDYCSAEIGHRDLKTFEPDLALTLNKPLTDFLDFFVTQDENNGRGYLEYGFHLYLNVREGRAAALFGESTPAALWGHGADQLVSVSYEEVAQAGMFFPGYVIFKTVPEGFSCDVEITTPYRNFNELSAFSAVSSLPLTSPSYYQSHGYSGRGDERNITSWYENLSAESRGESSQLQGISVSLSCENSNFTEEAAPLTLCELQRIFGELGRIDAL